MLLACLACLTTYAQTAKYIVKGQVVDSATQTPVEFATVSIKNKATGTEKKGLTDKNGDFLFEKLSPGSYEMGIITTGYQPVAITTQLSDSLQYIVDLGKIIVAQKVKQLKEVMVVTKKPLITQEIDRINYNVQEDPDSKTMNMLDMLRKVPFISVTGEDQVLFKGNSNFRVLLDGRSSSLLTLKNLKDVLKGIPASNILQIEVITVPPAKYESEGLAGIINIITNKRLKDGYNGSVNANYSKLFSGFSGSINLKKGKLGLSGFAGSSWESLPVSPFTLSLSQFSPTRFELRQYGDRRYNGNQVYANVFSSFEIDTINLLTASVGINTGINRQKNNQFSQLFDENEILAQSYGLHTSRKNKDNGWDAGINYQKGFKRNKAQLLTVSYKYVHTGNDLDNSNTLSQKLNYTSDDIRQENESGLGEHSGQLDYVHPLKKLTIEGGGKFIYRDKFSDFRQEDFNGSSGQFEPNHAQSDSFHYNQKIISFYNSYLLKVNNWAVRAGFRLESTIIDADFKSTHTIVKQDYTNLVPSFSFLYKFKNTSTVTLGYTQRIQRPGISLLNPFTDQSDPRFYRSGNPDLLPVRNHNILLNYSRFKKSTINLAFTYTFAHNTVQTVSSSAGDSIIRITYRNIGQYDNVGTNLNLTFPLSKSINLTANGTINYVWIEGIVDNKKATNQGLEGFAYSYLSYRAKKNWRFSLNAGFYGPVRNLQGSSNTYFYSSIGTSRQLFKQKGSLSLTISNPFQKYRTLRTAVNTPTFSQETVNKNYFRNIIVGFYYRFGKLSEEVKRNRRNINNDDKVIETGKAQ